MAATIGTARKYKDTYAFKYLPLFDYINLPTWAIKDRFAFNKTYKEPFFHYQEVPRLDIDFNIHGYFQSEKYFYHCTEEVRKVLTPKYEGKYEGYTSIHVRRTDYLTHKDCYTILDRNNYYNKAMEELPSDKYVIFSDDLQWCKNNFIGPQFSFSEDRDPIKDLGNIISCSNHIIANSSFSWWGAWLSPNKDKRVIAPSNWFGPKLSPTHDTKDLYPEQWEKI